MPLTNRKRKKRYRPLFGTDGSTIEVNIQTTAYTQNLLGGGAGGNLFLMKSSKDGSFVFKGLYSAVPNTFTLTAWQQGADGTTWMSPLNSIATYTESAFNPYGMCISPDGNTMVLSGQGGVIYFVDLRPVYAATPSSPTRIRTVSTAPGYMATFTPDGTKVLAISGTNLLVLNASTGATIATISLGSWSGYDVCVSPDGTTAYVSGLSAGIKVVNLTSNTLTATWTTGFPTNSRGIAITPDGAKMIVTNADNGTGSQIVIFNTSGTVLATTTVVGFPVGVAVSPDGKYATVTSSTSSAASFIDMSTNAVITTFNYGSYAYQSTCWITR